MTRAWVEVDLAALRRNGAAVAARAGVPLLPMVKADGYGLGALHVALALEELTPWGYGVATVSEGEELRRGGITRPIIVFTPILRSEIDAMRRADLTPALGDPAVIESWARTGRDWHLQIDTGMSRAGLRWDRMSWYRDILERTRPAGVFTHFHSADLDDDSREQQESRFEEALAELPVRPALVHAENGPAVEAHAPSRWSLCRPGIFLYGVASRIAGPLQPEPVAALRARIVEIRTISEGDTVGYGATWRAPGVRRIATVPVGYADGYRRALGNRGVALLRGQRIHVAGRVTMDMTMFDVTDTDAALGDVVSLLGRDGDEVVSVGELAALGELSPYELLTGLRTRLPRLHRDTDESEAAA
ncbi:MAG TPA: alanine racemase [Gemmatimonadaceae bacterium]|nr:alanine racemase [Gemmatimonadaceae bacterium]